MDEHEIFFRQGLLPAKAIPSPIQELRLTGQNIRVGPKHVLMSVSLQAVFTSLDGTAVLSCSAAGAAGKQQEFTITSPVVEIPGNVRAAVRIFDGKQASIDRLKTMTFFAALCPVVPDLYLFQVSFC
jgi:hypothetical protein